MPYTDLIFEDPSAVYPNISVDSDSNTRTNLSQEIQTKISVLQNIITTCEDKIIQWKRFRNSVVASVSRLPNELLVHIFMHLKSMEARLDDGMLSWIAVTHVCSHWRNAALDFPELWDRPYLGNYDCAAEMMRRAKSTPLDMVIFNGGQKVAAMAPTPYQRNIETVDISNCSAEAAKLAFLNMHRARRLYLWEAASMNILGSNALGVPGSHRHPWELNGLDASSLVQLTLRTSPTSRAYFYPAMFPFHKILSSTPKLRHLRLENWTLNRTASGFLGWLTELEISIDDSPYYQTWGEHMTPARIISTLTELSSLKSLRLRNLTTYNHAFEDLNTLDKPLVPQYIEFPRLRTLERPCLRILHGIYYPPTTSIHIKTRFMNLLEEHGEPDIYANMRRNEMNAVADSLQLLASRLEANPLGLFVTFNAELDCKPKRQQRPIAMERASRCSFSYSIALSASGCPHPTHLAVDMPMRTGIKLLPQICDLIPLHGLQELHCSMPYSDLEFWANVGRLPSIEKLTVDYTSPALLFVLSNSEDLSTPTTQPSRFTKGSEPCPSPPLFFPALLHLTMSRWQFGRNDESDLWAYPRAKGSLPDLIRSLSARYEQTHIPVKLNLHDCHGIAESDIINIIHRNNLNPNSVSNCITN